jgi:hypothetical protein
MLGCSCGPTAQKRPKPAGLGLERVAARVAAGPASAQEEDFAVLGQAPLGVVYQQLRFMTSKLI